MARSQFPDAGSFAEPAGPHLTCSLSRKAGVSSIREIEISPHLGLVRTGPLLQSQCRQKYLISGDYPSCFLGFSKSLDFERCCAVACKMSLTRFVKNSETEAAALRRSRGLYCIWRKLAERVGFDYRHF